jgi:hypothetical protein
MASYENLLYNVFSNFIDWGFESPISLRNHIAKNKNLKIFLGHLS